MANDKPFAISRFAFDDAFEEVRENKGSAGIDGMSIGAFEKERDDNLYKLWNRMSSGTYFPKPVKQVLIPKKNGKKRPLGIPTVTDRVAQTVVKNQIEPRNWKPYSKRIPMGIGQVAQPLTQLQRRVRGAGAMTG
jgi:RNA-directed DNA polymerase